MSAQEQPDQRMVGDLPLIEAARFDALGDDYWRERGFEDSWNVGNNLEFLQHLLLEEQEEGDVYIHSGCMQRWLERTSDQILFHPDVLPHWEAFVAAKKKQGGMQSFRIRDVVLPPAPFFATKLMPALQGSNDTLIRLDLIECKLGSSGLACVADFLTDNASLVALDISHNKIDDVADAKFLSLAIWNHPALNFVNLTHCGLAGTKGVLSEVLGGAGNLETLLLNFNAIDAKGMALVADFVATSTVITTLSVADNHVDEHKEALFTIDEIMALDSDSSASDSDSSDSSSDSSSSESSSDSSSADGRILFSRDKDDGFDNAVVIGKALKKNTSLRQLDLRRCSGLDIPAFVKSKRATELLTYLDLSRNRIGTVGGEMIAEYLARNPVLTELKLAWNGLTTKSAKLLADALKSNDTLQSLNLDYNRFNDDSVPFFADLLRNNDTLLSLVLTGNNIRIKTGARKELFRKAVCDTSSLDAIADSNHTCKLIFCRGTGGDTHELTFCNINALKDEAQKIRYKVVLAFFAFDNELFGPGSFDNLPLELMPRLLHLVQQEIGYDGFGEGIVKSTRKRRKNGFNPTLRRVYEVVSGWNQLPSLFARGPGKLRKKRKKRKRKRVKNDDKWTPRLAAAAARELKGLG